MDTAYSIGFAHGALCSIVMIVAAAALLAICWLIRKRHWLSDDWSFSPEAGIDRVGEHKANNTTQNK